MKPRFRFDLTQEQVKKMNLEKIINELCEAEEKGARKMIICSMVVWSSIDGNHATVEGVVLDNKKAAQVIKIVNPTIYKKNVELGAFKED